MENSPEFFKQPNQVPQEERAEKKEYVHSEKSIEGDFRVPAARENSDARMPPQEKDPREMVREAEEEARLVKALNTFSEKSVELFNAYTEYEKARSRPFIQKIAESPAGILGGGTEAKNLRKILQETEGVLEKSERFVLERALRAGENLLPALFIIDNILELSEYKLARKLAAWAESLLKDLNPEIYERAAAFGVNADSMLRAWRESARKKRFAFACKENLDRMSQIETQRPGVVRTLSTEFNIKDFARYPAELLIEQYDERNNPKIPYGVILYPVHDWSGVFYEHADLLKKLFTDLKEIGYVVRIAEIGSKIDAARALSWLDRRYGIFNKISFAIIGGHGTLDSIQFGSSIEFLREQGIEKRTTSPKMAKLRREDVGGKGIRRVVEEFFVSKPTFILISCSTGAPKGIGRALSNLGVEVIAPDISTNVKDIKVDKGAEWKPHFVVEYAEKKKGKTVSRRYVSGERLE